VITGKLVKNSPRRRKQRKRKWRAFQCYNFSIEMFSSEVRMLRRKEENKAQWSFKLREVCFIYSFFSVT